MRKMIRHQRDGSAGRRVFGAGGRGRYLIGQFKEAGVKVRAVCDCLSA